MDVIAFDLDGRRAILCESGAGRQSVVLVVDKQGHFSMVVIDSHARVALLFDLRTFANHGCTRSTSLWRAFVPGFETNKTNENR